MWRGTEIVLVLQSQKLALDLGDFFFHVVDLQKKLMEKQGAGEGIWRQFWALRTLLKCLQ